MPHMVDKRIARWTLGYPGGQARHPACGRGTGMFTSACKCSAAHRGALGHAQGVEEGMLKQGSNEFLDIFGPNFSVTCQSTLQKRLFPQSSYQFQIM